MLIITNQCNLRCTYCYEKHENHGSMSLEVAQENIRKVLNDDQKYSSITISIFGGEPFLEFKRMKEICEWTWKQNWKVPYKFSFSTNGTLLNSKSKAWLKMHKDQLFLVLSADGTEESQNINRSNSYSKIDYDFFTQTWKNPQVKMTVSKNSLKNLAKDIIFFHEKNFTFAECNLAMGIDWESERYTSLLEEQLQILLNYYIKHPELEPAQIINMSIGSCENKKVLKKWCGVGRELMTIDVDGKKYPCNYITPMSFNQDELEILLHYDFTSVREILDEDCYNKCYLYPVCPTCYGADYQLTKSFKKKDKTICKLMEIEAIYSAALKAERIVQKKDFSDFSLEEKGRMHKTIKAINNINLLYGK